MAQRSSVRQKAIVREEERDDCDDHVAWAVREWPTIDPDVEGIVSRTHIVARHIERSSVDTLDSLGLAHGELKVLLRLARGPRSHGDIARDLLVSTGTMTNRLDKLVAAGLVERHPDPADRRGVLVELTPAGRKTLDRYVSVQGAREAEMVGGMSAEDKRQLADLLRKLVASVEARSGLKRQGH